MGQGSIVTYKVAPDNRQRPSFRQASRITSTSAWAVASLSVSRRLCALAITSSPNTKTAPMGTSPSTGCLPGFCQSHSHKFVILHDPPLCEISGAPGRTRTTGTRFRKPLLYPPELRARKEHIKPLKTLLIWVELFHSPALFIISSK